MKTFGEQLVEYRRRLGMNQRTLAERAGLDPSHLNRIEKGLRKPPMVESVLRMIEALHLTQDEAANLVQLAGYSSLVLEEAHPALSTGAPLTEVKRSRSENMGGRDRFNVATPQPLKSSGRTVREDLLQASHPTPRVPEQLSTSPTIFAGGDEGWKRSLEDGLHTEWEEPGVIRLQKGMSISGAPIAATNQAVYVYAGDGYVYALNASNGSFRWRARIGDVSMQPEKGEKTSQRNTAPDYPLTTEEQAQTWLRGRDPAWRLTPAGFVREANLTAAWLWGGTGDTDEDIQISSLLGINLFDIFSRNLSRIPKHMNYEFFTKKLAVLKRVRELYGDDPYTPFITVMNNDPDLSYIYYWQLWLSEREWEHDRMWMYPLRILSPYTASPDTLLEFQASVYRLPADKGFVAIHQPINDTVSLIERKYRQLVTEYGAEVFVQRQPPYHPAFTMDAFWYITSENEAHRRMFLELSREWSLPPISAEELHFIELLFARPIRLPMEELGLWRASTIRVMGAFKTTMQQYLEREPDSRPEYERTIIYLSSRLDEFAEMYESAPPISVPDASDESPHRTCEVMMKLSPRAGDILQFDSWIQPLQEDVPAYQITLIPTSQETEVILDRWSLTPMTQETEDVATYPAFWPAYDHDLLWKIIAENTAHFLLFGRSFVGEHFFERFDTEEAREMLGAYLDTSATRAIWYFVDLTTLYRNPDHPLHAEFEQVWNHLMRQASFAKLYERFKRKQALHPEQFKPAREGEPACSVNTKCPLSDAFQLSFQSVPCFPREKQPYYHITLVPDDDETKAALVLLYVRRAALKPGSTGNTPFEELLWGLALLRTVSEGITKGKGDTQWKPQTAFNRIRAELNKEFRAPIEANLDEVMLQVRLALIRLLLHRAPASKKHLLDVLIKFTEQASYVNSVLIKEYEASVEGSSILMT